MKVTESKIKRLQLEVKLYVSVLDIPVGSLPSSKADFLPHERFFGKATPDSGSDLNSDSLMIM